MDKQHNEKGGSAGSKGSQFQVRLLAVFLLNALRMRLPNWRLSTEDNRAGKFDDVVLEWSEGTVLLQAKHKENKKKITVEQLMATTPKNEDFSIAKYFLSYQEIKDKFPWLTKAVICTNAGVNTKALTFLEAQADSSDSILLCERDTRSFHTLKDGILPELKEKIKTYFSQKFKSIEFDESIISDENLQNFQKYFQIYFDYPSGDNLENIIEYLLDGSSWRGKVAASEIYSKVMDWFQGEKRHSLTELHLKAMGCEIRRDKHWQSLKQYDVCFANNDLNFADSNRRYHFIVERACLLQEIRVWQALRGIGKKVLYIHPDESVEDQKQLIEAFSLDYFVVLILVQPSESVVMQMWDQIEKILNKASYKKIIFLTARDNELVRIIESSNNSFDVTKEHPTFENLLEDAQHRLLNSKKILFQGNVISLEELFVPEPIRNYKASFGSEILERLVEGEQIRVGSEVRVLEKEVERSYIPRNFIRKNEIRDEENIFEAEDRLVLIADKPGMGKTTTLTKLAVLMKERSPHLWVVKIVLDHYSKFLKDSLQEYKTVIDIIELLDFQESTRLIHQLDKLVFSRDKKVVLMLDGIDEISPNYTRLVESLLVSCLRTTNFIKIFATTRPHLVARLEEKFQVKSFMLEPFSEGNQIEYLKSHWTHNIKHADTEKCERYARALVSRMPSWTDPYSQSKDAVAAIPLQVRMVAEIFEGNDGVNDWEGCKEFLNGDSLLPKLPEKIDLARLYKLFVEKKRDVFIEKLNPSGRAGTDHVLFYHFEESIAFHRTNALKIIILDEAILDLFTSCKEYEKNCKVNAQLMGIMQETDNGLHFIHRTFAEYFVAECLIIELRQNQNAQFQKFLIDEILFQPRYAVICSFFDGLLQDCVNTLPRDIFRNYQSLSHDLESFAPDHFCLLHDLAERGCLVTLRFLLKCINFKIIRGKEIMFKELSKIIPMDDSPIWPRSFGNRLTLLQLFVEEVGLNIHDSMDRTPLHVAAGIGHLEMVQFLVKHGANVNTRSYTYTTYTQHTPLYEAAHRGHLAVVEFLVNQGADIMANVTHDESELYEIIRRKHVPIVSFLLEKIIERVGLERGLDPQYAMIPFAASYVGRIDIVKSLVERGLDVNRTLITNQQSLIFGAAIGGQFETLEYLVKEGADIFKTDITNNTVLHLVSRNPSLTDIAEYFVNLGIDTEVKGGAEQTPLHFAVSTHSSTMAELLIKSGSDVNSTSKRGYSILYTAALDGQLVNVELLAQHGANINIEYPAGYTPLHAFAEMGRLDVIKCLVKLGADVTARDRDGGTALHVAALQRRADVAKYLIECSNIDVNSRDNDGRTVLHLCVSMEVYHRLMRRNVSFHTWTQRLDILKCLAARGADFQIRNNKGETALYLAILTVALHCSLPSCDPCLLLVKFLIEQGASIGSESSKGDVRKRLIEEIQEGVRHREQSLEAISRLPVFELLDSITPLDREDGPLGRRQEGVETTAVTPP